MSGEKIDEIAVRRVYNKRLDAVAEYLSQDEGMKIFFDNLSKDDIIAGLNEPTIRVFEGGGVLSYYNHNFDDVHIIDLEFGGVLEKFYEVSING